LGVFALLIGTIPAGFLVDTPLYREHEATEYFEAIDIQYFAETWEYTLNATGGTDAGAGWYFIDIDIGNRDFDMWYKKASNPPLKLYFVHRYTWLIFPVSHKMKWITYNATSRGDELEVTEMELDTADLRYTTECSHFSVKTFFAYNETTYSNVTDAWNGSELNMLVGINFDEVQTGMNAWNLIAMILFLQMPDVHPLLNAFIALPIWVCIAWLTASFIIAFLKSLPLT